MSTRTNSLANQRIAGIVFDMDGTLSIQNLDFDEMYRLAGVPKDKDILTEIKKMSPERAAEASRVVQEIEADGARTMQLMPGVIQCFQHLATKDVKLALVTRNSTDTVLEFYRRLWLPAGLPPFSPAISRDGEVLPPDQHLISARPSVNLTNLPPKPDPGAFFAIAEYWQLERGNHLVMVGDSPGHDIAFGVAAGATTVLIDVDGSASTKVKPHSTPDFVVQDWSEMTSLFSSHL